MEAFPRIAILSTIFEDAESDSDINDISEEENNNKERIVKGRIPELSSRMENEDNKQQEPAESAETETSETSLTFGNYSIDETRDKMRSLTSQDSISQYITEDNVQQIIDGILEESNLSDLEDNGNTCINA